MRDKHFGAYVLTKDGLSPLAEDKFLGQAVDIARKAKDLQPELSVHVTYKKDGEAKSILELQNE